jgi:hypothetical protein
MAAISVNLIPRFERSRSFSLKAKLLLGPNFENTALFRILPKRRSDVTLRIQFRRQQLSSRSSYQWNIILTKILTPRK